MNTPQSLSCCATRNTSLDGMTRGLPIWVLLAMALGLGLGKLQSVPLKVFYWGMPLGLFFMIWPAMTKLHLEDLRAAASNRRAAALIVIFNYLLNPFLLWLFGWLFLRHEPELWTGLILLGVAPCIAMVLVWTDLSGGNNALSIALMAWNSLIQMITTPFFIWLIIGSQVHIDVVMIAQSVILYLGLPLALGVITRRVALRWRGAVWFDDIVQPKLDRLQLLALLCTLAVIYAQQGNVILQHPDFILRLALPLCLFFVSLYVIVFFVARTAKQNYADSTAIAYNATGRNFELAIAIAVTAFAAQPLVGVSTAIGPLIEVPLMLLLVKWSRAMANKLRWRDISIA